MGTNPKNNSSKQWGKVILSFWRRMARTLIAYKHQNVFPAAFGLALLYMTVLGFDGLAISFGKSQGLADDILGVFRSLGSVLGICGAISYAWIERKVGVNRTGLFGLAVNLLLFLIKNIFV